MVVNRRWLGIIAIGIGVLLLFSWIGGRGGYGHWGRYDYPGAYAPAPPQWGGPGAYEQRPADPGYARGYQDGLWAAQGRDRHHGPPRPANRGDPYRPLARSP